MYNDTKLPSVDQALLQRFCVAEANVEKLMAFGEQNNYCFLLEKERGVLEEPLRLGDWVYQEFDPNSNTLHPKAEECLRLVLETGVPIRQIIYGYWDGPVQTKTQSRPRIHIPARTVETAAWIAKSALVVAASAAMVVGYAFLTALSAVDPKLIVVLDTGAAEKDLPWVCLMSWEDAPEDS